MLAMAVTGYRCLSSTVKLTSRRLILSFGLSQGHGSWLYLNRSLGDSPDRAPFMAI